MPRREIGQADCHAKRVPPPLEKQLSQQRKGRNMPSITSDDWQALGSVATAFLAGLVFLEARRIRRTEWMTRLNQLWNDFNRVVADSASTTRIADILNGISVAPPVTSREAFILFQFLNVVSTEYLTMRASLLVGNYAIESFMDTASVVRANPWLLDLVRERGWEPSFIRVLGILAAPGDKESLRKRIRREIWATSLPARLLGARFRVWLSPDPS